MAADQIYDIRERSQDPRILSRQKYRNSLYYVAQSAIWIGNAYVVLRILSILLSPQKWQMWAMFLVEAVFIRECYRHLGVKETEL
jgi:hypothetical protein